MRCPGPKGNVSKCITRRFDANFKLMMALYAEKVKFVMQGGSNLREENVQKWKQSKQTVFF